MRQILPLFAIASLCLAADFVTGQAARFLIGQETFTRQFPGTSQAVLGAASGLAYANDTLFVADSSRIQAFPQNNRVMIYRNLSQRLPRPTDQILYKTRCNVCITEADLVLGQPDFSKNDVGLSQTGMRTPTAVATDGRVLAVADTDNNRVLIWLSLPTSNNQPADVVVGQGDFKSNTLNYPNGGRTPSAKGLSGPQGVWIQNGKLFVADTQNHRVLIWNRIPTQNGQDADVVLGQANFTTFVEPDIARTRVDAKATTLLNPVSVTSDGTRLYVTDLGHNRVLIWNSIPTSNQAPADIAIGQPDMTSAVANNVRALCAPIGKNDKNEDIYPERCAATLDFPRFALSDGQRLFIADGGNDRVLVFNSIPTSSGKAADVILGQFSDRLALNSGELRISSADTVRTPMSLAWDGTNLYVSSPFDRRVLVFSPGDFALPFTGVRNAASRDIFAVGSVTFSGKIKENDEVTIKIGSREYKYKIAKDDTFGKVISELVAKINAGEGDPQVYASPNTVFQALLLTARISGEAGNEIEYSATVSSGAEIAVQTSGARLNGGQDAAKIAPGSLVTILGEKFTDRTATADTTGDELPLSLAGVEVYFDGIRAPLLYVAPDQINAQIPYDVNDATSVNVFVRSEDSSGRVRVSTPLSVPIIPQNPGIFAEPGPDPRPAIALHYSSRATGAISVDGTIKEGDIATVTIEDRQYQYTVKKEDTLASVRDRLIELINANPDERVEAFPASQFTRIRLRAKQEGEAGEGIPYAAKVNEGGNLILTPLTPALCCANRAGERITEENPARPGETIVIYATGLGFVQPDEAKLALSTGKKYRGPAFNSVVSPVDSLAGGKTANVLFAGAKEGEVGVYELHLQLNPDLPTNPRTQLTIAQDVYISNIVTFPVKNPKDEQQ
jgi:hypothetical protein